MTKSINDLLKRLTDAQAATQRQLAELQQQVTSSQETSTKLVVQKIEEERGYTFRKKEHEKQWRFNKVVGSHLDNALDEIKKFPRSIDENTAKIMENIQEELSKGREEIADRQKKIKMADSSEYSWGMVEAYERDELADDSADEKRMEKAEKEAEKSATKRSRVPSSSRQEGPEQKWQPSWEQQERSLVPARFPPQPPARQKLPGPCWSCGKFGHLAATCSQTSKWYPFSTPVAVVGDSSHPTRAHLCDITGIDCLHEFGFAGVGEDITNWSADLPNKAAEKSRYGEEILDPTLENPDAPCPTEKAWEIEEATEEQGTIVVKGRLREHVDFWREVVKAPGFIIDCIQYGYKLPLFSEPPPNRLSNSASALKYKDFVLQAVAELLRNGCVKKLDSAPHVCSPLSVVVNTKGKKHLVINLRYLNQFLKRNHLNMKTCVHC